MYHKATDLDYILEHTSNIWQALRNSRIFMTGGTGFFGNWLLDSFLWAYNHLTLNSSLVVLTRNIQAFQKKRPALFEHTAIEFYEGDVKNFIPPPGKFSHVIHAAADASAYLNKNYPLEMLDTILEGTRHTLAFADTAGVEKFLFISSGAVYGRQPFTLSYIPEDYPGAPAIDDLHAAYGIAKRTAEHMCLQFHRQYGLDIKIARCFAFAGPYLPLDTHFAIGNFILAALRGKPIILTGDGTSCRSYLYASELTIGLWCILEQGITCRPYNVGSDQAITTLDLAKLVASCAKQTVEVQLDPAGSAYLPASRYVPCIERAKKELSLPHQIDLRETIMRTLSFYEENLNL